MVPPLAPSRSSGWPTGAGIARSRTSQNCSLPPPTRLPLRQARVNGGSAGPLRRYRQSQAAREQYGQ
ncbi:MAG: hypothetical protein WKG07_03865 [Hymenobacter sp.]